MRSQRILKLTILFSIFCLPGCGTLYSTSRLITGPSEKELNAICEAKGGLDSPGPLYVDGYYLPDASPLFGFDDVIIKLGKGRFQFFEMDTAFVEKVGNWRKAEIKLIKGQGKYTRFYLAKRGDENCKMFEYHLSDTRKLAQEKAHLRAYGIYPENCVAAIKTDKLKSKYTLKTFVEPDQENPNIIWGRDQVVSIETGDVYAGYNQFSFCLKGNAGKNECRGDLYDIYSCSPEIEGYQKGYKAIYYGTLKSNPNPILKKQLETVDIHIPLNVTPRKVEPELVQIRIGKKNIKHLIHDEVSDLYQSIEPEGYAWFGSRTYDYVYYSTKSYKNYDHIKDGEFIGATIQQIEIINEDERKLLKIDIGISDSRLGKYFDYCCLRAIKSDGIFFLAWGGVNELSEKANKFKILNYSWEGELRSVIEGTLPMDFSTWSDNPLNAYGRLVVNEDKYMFSVFTVARGDFGNRTVWPFEERVYKVPKV